MSRKGESVSCVICKQQFVVSDNGGNRMSCGSACAAESRKRYFREYNSSRSNESLERARRRQREYDRLPEIRAKRTQRRLDPGRNSRAKEQARSFYHTCGGKEKAKCYRNRPAVKQRIRDRRLGRHRQSAVVYAHCAVCLGWYVVRNKNHLFCSRRCRFRGTDDEKKRHRRLEYLKKYNLKRRDKLLAYMKARSQIPQVKEQKLQYMAKYNKTEKAILTRVACYKRRTEAKAMAQFGRLADELEKRL